MVKATGRWRFDGAEGVHKDGAEGVDKLRRSNPPSPPVPG
jgi:hypothetical protein